MATERVELQFTKSGDRDVIAATRGVNGQLREMDQHGGAAARQMGNLGSSSAEAGVSVNSLKAGTVAAAAAVAALAAAVVKTVSAISDWAQEMDRQVSVLNRFNGNVAEAERRTAGLFSRFELITAQNQVMQAGLELTEDQFATLAVAANEYAASIGIDNVQAMQRLTQAVSQGSTRALKALGIDMEGITDLADKQEFALAALEEKYGDVSSEADTLGGRIGILENHIENATLDFNEGFGAAQGLDQAFDDLVESSRQLADVFGIDLVGEEGGLSKFVQIGAGAAALAQVLIERFSMLVRAAQELSKGTLEGAARAAALVVEANNLGSIQDRVIQLAGENMVSALQNRSRRAGAQATASGRSTVRPRLGGGGGGGGGGRDGPSQADQQMELFRGATEGQVRGSHELDEEVLIGTATVVGPTKDELRAMEEAAERTREIGSAAADSRTMFEKLNDQMLKTGEAGRQVGMLLFDIWENGPRRALQSFLEATAKRNAIAALEELARAAGSYPDPVGITSHLEAAALHAAVAAAAGGGAAALGSGGGSRGGGSGGAPSAGSVGGRQSGLGARDVGPNAQGRDGGGGVSIIIHQPNVVQTKADQGRMIDAMIRAARREGLIGST